MKEQSQKDKRETNAQRKCRVSRPWSRRVFRVGRAPTAPDAHAATRRGARGARALGPRLALPHNSMLNVGNDIRLLFFSTAISKKSHDHLCRRR